MGAQQPCSGTPLIKRILIGRSSSCDIQLKEKSISGKHAEFSRDPETNVEQHPSASIYAHLELWLQVVLLTDLGSGNGTKLDGDRIEPKTAINVTDGQLITFGKLEAVFMLRFKEWEPPRELPNYKEILAEYNPKIDAPKAALAEAPAEAER